jgi:hypothetical protein
MVRMRIRSEPFDSCTANPFDWRLPEVRPQCRDPCGAAERRVERRWIKEKMMTRRSGPFWDAIEGRAPSAGTIAGSNTD